jgi:hypothetical protein
MVTWILWTAGLALESVILARFLRSKLYRHYPLFFSYMSLVWLSSVILLPIFRIYPDAYTNSYWALQFLTLLAGFGVMLELVQKSFQNYPGAKAFATVVLVMMFVILCGYFSYKVLAAQMPSTNETFSELERDFRVLQAIVLAGILVVISYYRIDIGRNLKGIVSGFGLYVGNTILSQAIRTYAGPSFDRGWETIQPYTYFVALLIWVVTLWSYAPVPLPESPLGLVHEYDALARRTKERLGAIRADVGRTERE